jgi:hypothetical protein
MTWQARIGEELWPIADVLIDEFGPMSPKRKALNRRAKRRENQP